MRRLIFLLNLIGGLAIAAGADQLSSRQPYANRIPEYDLRIKLEAETHRLEVNGTMKLPASDSPRENLQLALSELMSDFEVEVVQPVASAGIARLEKKERVWERPGWGTTTWTIHPVRMIPAGEPVVLRFSYAGGGHRTSFGFYLGPEGSFGVGILTAWYPEMEEDAKVRLRGVRGIGTLRFSVPVGYTVYTMGAQRSTAEETARGIFSFEITKPIFFSFGAARYTLVRRGGVIPISLYLLHPRQNSGKLIEGCSKVLAALAQEFGPYPFGLYPPSGFAIVEVPTEQADQAGFSGASVDGFMFGNSIYFDQEFNTAFYGHEIGHQWWGGSIRKRGSRGSYMLDEAMAQYSALRAVEKIEGANAAEQFRRTGYPGWPEYCAITYLSRVTAGFDHRLADLPSDNDFLSRRVANSKGMLAWDMLSRTVGRQRFSQILKDIGQQYAYRRISWEEFLQAIEKRAGRNLSWFYEQWFERTGAPEWQLSYRQQGRSLKAVVNQSAPYYRGEVELQIAGSGPQQSIRVLNLNGSKTEFVFPVAFKVKSATLDPHFLVLHWAPEYREQSNMLLPYTKGDLKLWQGKNEEAYKEFKAGLDHLSEPDKFGLRFLLEYGLARALTDQNRFAEAKEHILASLASPTRRVDTLPWAYLQLATIAQKMKDQVTLLWAINAVIFADAAAGRRTGAVEQALSLKNNKPAPQN